MLNIELSDVMLQNKNVLSLQKKQPQVRGAIGCIICLTKIRRAYLVFVVIYSLMN